MLTVNKYALALVWTETNTSLLEGGSPDAPLRGLRERNAGYPRIMEPLIGRASGESDVGYASAPWLGMDGKRFWVYYLDKHHLSSVKTSVAWAAQVPLRITPPIVLEGLPGHAEGSASAFIHPFAISFVVDFLIEIEPLEIGSFVDHLHLTLSERSTTVAWRGASTEWNQEQWLLPADQPHMLKSIVHSGIDSARRVMLGSNAPEGHRVTGEPICIITLLSGESDSDPQTLTPTNGSDVHRWLHGMSSRSQTWRADEMKPVSAHLLKMKGTTSGNTGYAERTSRILWFPFSFTAGTSQASRRLKCYHSNLVAGTMQTSALCGLLNLGAQRYAHDGGWPPAYEKCLVKAATQITKLHQGTDKTYRSNSLRRLIDDLGGLYLIDRTRRALGWPAVRDNLG